MWKDDERKMSEGQARQGIDIDAMQIPGRGVFLIRCLSWVSLLCTNTWFAESDVGSQRQGVDPPSDSTYPNHATHAVHAGDPYPSRLINQSRQAKIALLGLGTVWCDI